MGISRRQLLDLGRLMMPMATRVANSIARAVVRRVDDLKKLQLLQIDVLEDETLDEAEHVQPYGFYSVPIDGAEAVVLFPNGDRAHPLVVVVGDRRYRPTGGQPGETGLHNHVAAVRVRLLPSGDIEINPAAGREVFIRTAGGSVDRLVKKSEFDGHTHGPGSFAAGGDPVTGATAGAAAVAGTSRLRAE